MLTKQTENPKPNPKLNPKYNLNANPIINPNPTLTLSLNLITCRCVTTNILLPYDAWYLETSLSTTV